MWDLLPAASADAILFTCKGALRALRTKAGLAPAALPLLAVLEQTQALLPPRAHGPMGRKEPGLAACAA